MCVCVCVRVRVILQSLFAEWTWSSSTSEDEVACPPRRYIIRIRDAGSSRVKSLRYDPAETSAVVGGLRAGSVQRVRLVVDTPCRLGRSRSSRWIGVRLPASRDSTPGRITKSVRDLHARDRAFQRQTRITCSCIVFCCT